MPIFIELDILRLRRKMHLKYRPEIDGLRTIAVLSVLIYHAEFVLGSGKLLSGGFLGVDIFFVISGFLITSLIIKEQNKTGSFSIADFYERRARRLLPALFLVILVSLPFAWLYLLPSQFIDFSKSQLSSVFFASNFYWDNSLQKYGAESAMYKPFLHTWSLAVEEQFYIIFPLILIALYRWLKTYTLSILSIFLIASLIYAEWLTGKDASSSFYMLPSRFWELLSGSLLAYHLYKHPQEPHSNSLKNFIPVLGLGLITYSLFFIEYNDNHPGFITLTVVIGTLLIIWFSNKTNPVTRLLSSKFFVGVGLISYSLYLWHYPIFSFGRILNSSPSVNEKIIWFILSFCLALISYYLIEKPSRNKVLFSKRSLVFTLSLTAIIIVGLNAAIIHNKGYSSRLPSIISDIEMRPSKIGICYKKQHCSFNNDNSNNIILVGDSHLMSLERALLDYSNEKQLKFTTLTTNGCQYILNLNSVDKKNNQISQCNTSLQNSRRELLLNVNNALIVIGGNLPSIIPNNIFEKKSKRHLQYPDLSIKSSDHRISAIFREYRNTVLELANNNHKIILVYPIPTADWDIPSKISQLIFRKNDSEVESILNKSKITISYPDYISKTKSSFDLLDSIKHKNISRIYPHKLFCNTSIPNRCITHDQKTSYYRDEQHLSKKGTDMLFEVLKTKINKENTFQ